MRSILRLFILILFSGIPTWAQSVLEQQARIQGVTVQAENMERDSERDTVEVTGNVQIIYKDQHLKADRARINFRAKSIEAFGNVLVTTPQANIAGQKVVLDYETDTGVIFDGFVQSGTVLFEGSRINKLSATEFIADDARYTTCTTCPEAWSFSGSKVRADMGSYAYIKGSVLRFASVPVFWLPYLVVPLKSERQSGLLPPSFGSSSSGGLIYEQSYFWAMSRSDDSTWTLKNYEKRGLKGLFNYRYMLAEESFGEFDFGFLKDKEFAKEPRLNSFRPEQAKNDINDRYFLKYSHYYSLPDDFIHRLQINDASDLQYSRDFPRETGNSGDPAMETRTSLTKNTKTQHYSLDASYYKNLLQSNPNAGNDSAVHRLPELNFSQTQSRIGNSDYLYSIDLNYSNFQRTSFAYDNLNSDFDPKRDINDRWVQSNCAEKKWETKPECQQIYDGEYNQNKDLIRTGQRLSFKPSVYKPIKLNNFDLLPKLTYHETQYLFPVGKDSRNIRRLFRADLSTKTTFSRIYGDFNSLQSERTKHEIQPELALTAIPWIHHPRHEFFGNAENDNFSLNADTAISDADLNGATGLQFDYEDRLTNRRLVTMAFTNKLTKKSWENGAPVYLQYLNWRLAQSYDAYLAERNPEGQPLSQLSSELQLKFAPFDINQTSFYYPYQKVTNTSTRLRVTSSRGDFFQIEQILNFSVSPGKDVDPNTRVEDYPITIMKTSGWFDIIGKLVYGDTTEGKKLKSWAYSGQLKPPGDCLSIRLSQFRTFRVSDQQRNDIETKIDFAFTWDGQTQPRIGESFLQGIGF